MYFNGCSLLKKHFAFGFPDEDENIDKYYSDIFYENVGFDDVPQDAVDWDGVTHSMERDDYSMSLEEVGQQLGVTREGVRQIEQRALRKLRHPKKSKELRFFTKYLAHRVGCNQRYVEDVYKIMGVDVT